MVCLEVIDATTTDQIKNVDFFTMRNGNASSSNLGDPDGKICYSVPRGTDFNVTVRKVGFNDGNKHDLMEQDATWVIPMNPIVRSSQSSK